ncbi:MAG: tRNA lysidine(34) synthetase TilS [Treponema sp.]|nr:tRNA lysidine(34) synthetase TilS [Treponema sp.]
MVLTGFEEKVSAVLDCFPAETVFLAAVSGGADSMAMLAALLAVKKERLLFCLHVEHGLRPASESSGDADFVKAFCKSNGIKCRVVHILKGKIADYSQRKGTGIEAAARYFRHRVLSKEADRLGKNTVILLAHTKNDLLELSLMRVLRGAGPMGLAIMPQKRGRLFRPLLNMTRSDITGYLTEKNISWREDATNTDVKFLRNRIRRRLVPFLNETFPIWKKGVYVMAETQALVSEFIVNEAAARIKWERTSESLFTNEENFFTQPQIIREEAVFLGINFLCSFIGLQTRTGKLKTIKRSVLGKFCTGRINAADLGLYRLKREKGKVILSRVKKEFFERGVSQLI